MARNKRSDSAKAGVVAPVSRLNKLPDSRFSNPGQAIICAYISAKYHSKDALGSHGELLCK